MTESVAVPPTDQGGPWTSLWQAGWFSRRYDRTIQGLLQELGRGARYAGPRSLCHRLLDYVARHRPIIRRTHWIDRWGFAGFTLPLPGRYAILLNPRWVCLSPEEEEKGTGRPGEATLRSAATLAHELGHALWNSHGFDSVEEEYFVDRMAAGAFWEMLRATGWGEKQATDLTRYRFRCLEWSLEEAVAAYRERQRRHPLRPWTWFDRARTADLVSSIVFLPWVHLGVWGHGFWVTDRQAGRRARVPSPP